jgi:hypothetical protein
MKILKNKLKNLIGNNKLDQLMDDVEVVIKEKVKGYIDYNSGLWLSGWVAAVGDNAAIGERGYENCTVKINGQEIYCFTANLVRADLLNIPDLKHGMGFDLQLPVQACANLLKRNHQLVFSVCVGNEEVAHNLTMDRNSFYQNAFNDLYNDINCYISNIPLFTEESIRFLSCGQKLFLLNALFETGLDKNLGELALMLVEGMDLTPAEQEESSELVDKLRHNGKFVSLFLRANEKSLFHNAFSRVIINTLRVMPYLSSKDIIQSNISDQEILDKLLLSCVAVEEKKFDFIEAFPSDISEGLMLWESLSQRDKREYWPLLAGTLQFQNRHNELKFISIDPFLYLEPEQEGLGKDQKLKAAINKHENQWFALSFIVQTVVNGRSSSFVAELLKEFSWKAWSLDFFDTDTFSYVSNRLLDSEITDETYSDICEAFKCVIQYAAEHDRDSLHRKVFVSALVKVINYGIKHQYADFSELETLARPYLCLTNTFSDNLDISPLKASNYNQYTWLGEFYRKTEKVRAFFLNFDAANNYQDIELVEILEQLLKLKRKYEIKDINSRLLGLSRYCQLTEREQLFPLLKSIHAELGDYYTALQLETDPIERIALTQRITEYGKNSKRADSFWFSEVLKARLDKSGSETATLVARLNEFLQCSQKSPQGVNSDLAELLVSEVIWLNKIGKASADLIGSINSIASQFSNTTYNSLKLHTSLADTVQVQKNTVDFVNTVENVLGGSDALQDTIDSLGLTMSSVYDKNERLLLEKRIEEYYIYPYTRVLVYSCNKYESTRHRVIRDTWLKDLEKYDIAYSIVVGDAEKSHMEGDKMCLRVRDTYEELPQKSLSMFEFAASNSHHRHYYKIDDDCILNVNAMFGDPAFLNSEYFGRIVTRPLGGVDRSWHHVKSSATIAKESLDLSPEMSVYCDGSTGYILSRSAVKKLTEQAYSTECVQLISSSYFEDKLIGDLLSKAQVPTTSSGYNTVIKRSIANGRDVQIWDYGLLPNSETNIKVLHTEDDDFRLNYYAQLHSNEAEIPELLYRDITSDMDPAWASATEQAPVLETLRIDEKAIRNATVVAIIVGKNEQEFLPNLLQHHRDLGVEHFLFVDNASSDSSIDYMLDQSDVSVFIATQDYKFSRFGVNWQETLCSHYCLGKWTLIIDSDELFMFDGFEDHSIQELVAKADAEGANAVLSPMVDFYPGGTLEKADVTINKPFYEVCEYFDSLETMNVLSNQSYGPFSNSKVYSAGLRERIFGRYNSYPQPNYLNQKYNLIKYLPSMRLIEGLHFMHGHRTFEAQCGIMHFKYHSGFHAKVMREVESGQHWNGAKEYRRYLDLFEKNATVKLFDEKVSTRYEGSRDLVKAGYVSEIDWSI